VAIWAGRAAPAPAASTMPGTARTPRLGRLLGIKTTGAVLGGRDGWDRATSGSRPDGGAWDGLIFVPTRHPQDAASAD
jgi:hypothetical protein